MIIPASGRRLDKAGLRDLGVHARRVQQLDRFVFWGHATSHVDVSGIS